MDSDTPKVTFWTEYVKTALGIIVFMLICVGGFWVSSLISSELMEKDWGEVAALLVAGLSLAAIVLILGGVLTWMLNRSVVTIAGEYLLKLGHSYTNIDQTAKSHADQLNDCARSLRSSTKLINTILVDEDKGLIPATKDIVQEYVKAKHFGRIVLTGEFDEIQRNFMSSAELKGSVSNELRIVGTMLGTFGESGLNLASHLSNLTTAHEQRLAPFKKAYFGVPGHVDGGIRKNDDDYYLYPYSARITAADVLLKQKHANLKEHLEIHIRFLNRSDIFPAIQLWDDKCGMLLPSAGVRDRTSDRRYDKLEAITEALPIALVFLSQDYTLTVNNSERKCNLTDTLCRLKEHLENDFELTGEGCEVWSLSKSRDRIHVHNFNRELDEHAMFIREVERRLGPGQNVVDDIEKIIDTFAKSSTSGVPIGECRQLIDKLISYIARLTEK